MRQELKESVATVLRDGNRRILLGQRQNTGRRDGSWSLPGTMLLVQETPLAAIARNLREELDVLDPITSSSFRVEEAPDILLHVFVIDGWTGTIKNLDTKFCAGFEWFDLKSLPPATPSSRLVIDAYIQSQT